MRSEIGLILALLGLVCAYSLWSTLDGERPDAIQNGGQKILKEVTEKVKAGIDVAADMVPEAAGPQRPEATTAPPAPPPTEPEPTSARNGSPAPASRISLPGFLKNVKWGMNSRDVSRAYKAAWMRQSDTVMLVHYPNAEHDLMVQFHLVEDSLTRVDVSYRPPESQTLHQFYERMRQQLQQLYSGLPEAHRTSWSDGRVRLGIALDTAKNWCTLSYQRTDSN